MAPLDKRRWSSRLFIYIFNYLFFFLYLRIRNFSITNDRRLKWFLSTNPHDFLPLTLSTLQCLLMENLSPFRLQVRDCHVPGMPWGKTSISPISYVVLETSALFHLSLSLQLHDTLNYIDYSAPSSKFIILITYYNIKTFLLLLSM